MTRQNSNDAPVRERTEAHQKAEARYRDQMADKGMTKVAVTIPARHRDRLLKYAAKLRREG